MVAPIRTEGPPEGWLHRGLYQRVRNALYALPGRFRTQLRIAGISAVDLFTLNTPLGAAIEQSVVDSLNDVREIWDPDGQYKLYSFIRQAQVFPDVRLETTAPNVADGDRVLMGIELKGWFVLHLHRPPANKNPGEQSPTIYVTSVSFPHPTAPYDPRKQSLFHFVI